MKHFLLSLLLFLVLAHGSAYAANAKALVYRGPGACPGCPETVVDLLQRMGIKAHYIGPGQLTLNRLKKADFYVQPGGTDHVEDTMRALSKSEVNALRTYVQEGGRYLGICAGGYLAGQWTEGPKKLVATFGFIPGIVQEESKNQNARAEPVNWSGKTYWLYFQDGPQFDTTSIPDAKVWAVYSRTGHAAALMAPVGRGRIGLIGPHPEAEMDWFTDDHITAPDGLHPELAIDFIKALLN